MDRQSPLEGLHQDLLRNLPLPLALALNLAPAHLIEFDYDHE